MPKPVQWIFVQPKEDVETFDPVEIVQLLERYPRKELRVIPGKEFDKIVCRHKNEIGIIYKTG